MSIQQTEQESASIAREPDKRIKLADIEGRIHSQYESLGVDLSGMENEINDKKVEEALSKLSLCILVMDNGFVVVGKSAPLSPVNFDAEYGKKLAYEDAIRQLWPLMAFGRLESEREKERS